MSDKGESKKERSATESTSSAEAPPLKLTAASIAQDKLVVPSFTSVGVNRCMDTIRTDYGVWRICFLFYRQHRSNKHLAVL